jgi:hypothetical protein
LNPEKIMLNSARDRARKLNLPFDIEATDIIIPDVCPWLGIPLYKSKGRGRPHPNTPTLDRLVPSKGYVKGNVIVISYRANRLKSDATSDELRLISAGIEDALKV